jgi:hypothetical protein
VKLTGIFINKKKRKRKKEFLEDEPQAWPWIRLLLLLWMVELVYTWPWIRWMVRPYIKDDVVEAKLPIKLHPRSSLPLFGFLW